MSRERSSISCSRRILAVAGLGLLAGCGFRPVYADRPAEPEGGASVRDELAATRVALIPERTGQVLRSALNGKLRNGGGEEGRYELRVAVRVTRQAVGVRRDQTATRLRVAAVANFILSPLPEGEPLTRGQSYAVDAYNIVTNQYFASQLSGEQADRRIAERLAEDIVAQLASFYARRPTATPEGES